jgi:DnaJ-class molecular chaperone
MAEDYYQLLQVQRSASSDEIQKAYRKLARKYHPDLHADKSDQEKEKAKQQFQQIQRAYDVLNDPEKREMYDRFGPGFDSAGGGAGPNPFQGGNPFGNMDIDLSQIFGGAGGPGFGGAQNPGGGFENLFRQFGGGAGGRGPGPQQPPDGQDVEQEITVPFNTAALGGEHQLSLQRRGGKIDTITVKIPAGIENGKKIRLRGQGETGGPSGKRGDLLIKVRVAKHPIYSRDGVNLKITVPVTLKEAIFGAKIDVPTPKGTVSVTVPQRSSNGKTLRLKGLGIATSKQTGDLLVRLQIHIPDEISDEDAKVLESLSVQWEDPAIRDDLKW